MSLEKAVSKIVPRNRDPILGLELRPFCLGHYFLMQEEKNGFIPEVGNTVGLTDLLIGLLICSRTYEEFLEFRKLEDNSWLDRTTVWQWLCKHFTCFTYHPLSLNQWCKKWGKQVRKAAKRGDINLITEFNRFRHYMNEGIEDPSYDIEQEADSNRAESGTHWADALLSLLTTKLNKTETEAMNLAMCRAFAEKYKWLEAEGIITINSEADKELFKLQEAHGINLLGDA